MQIFSIDTSFRIAVRRLSTGEYPVYIDALVT